MIEAVFEDMKIKKQIFQRLDQICKKGAILASNTSRLSIDEIAGATKRPEDVIGCHFFSPANVMKLLENVRGLSCSSFMIIHILISFAFSYPPKFRREDICKNNENSNGFWEKIAKNHNFGWKL